MTFNIRTRPRRRPALAVPSPPLTFPIREDRRLLPNWREFEHELRGLHYPAQEVVCQILTAHAKGYSPEITNSLNERRKSLRRILNKLNRLKRNLSLINADAVAGLCNSLREIHRPTPAPFSAGERIQLPISSADFVRWKIADPGEALEHLAGSLVIAKHSLDQEIAFIHKEIKYSKPIWKTRPHLWWRKGCLYYVLERIFREASVRRTSLAEAHKRMIPLLKKLPGRKSQLTFDPEKGYAPAIRSGIDRCEYKRLCDQYLEERLAFPPKKHQ